ncbi:SMP-30/gluconolactonase/LRE family protein [Kribbella albertanoniae]|uniref:SMP-30/gluconolactonase/LRE family protein n=1 Tax=Kribbella albertanoniae TaxID=1266829 RepID=A0A4R4QBI7_9ACTN|nr:SMP-30/gluconolactonase/LRE family protein [Kribbella albertanoniae]TDC32801.1 SMP-30/gluconolactonase/LRE family protein [Kribbella albertanoniae]
MKPSIAPVRWTPPPADATRAPLTIEVATVAVPGHGPEDTLIDEDGSVLTGLLDGRILRVSADGTAISVLGDTGGRPLGLEWLPDGKVLVCDANRGLLTLDKDGRVTTLLAEIDGRPMRFCNNAAVAPDGTIYFTDSSTRFGFENWKADLLEHSATGSVYRLTPDGTVTRLAGNRAFPNGVALSADHQTLYWAETATYAVYQLDVSTPDAEPAVLARVPGLPDNISRGSDGLIWVTIGSPRNPMLDLLLPKAPILRKIVWALPDALQPQPADIIEIQAYHESGTLIHDLRGTHPDFHMPTGVRERDGNVWLASIGTTTIATFPTPPR